MTVEHLKHWAWRIRVVAEDDEVKDAFKGLFAGADPQYFKEGTADPDLYPTLEDVAKKLRGSFGAMRIESITAVYDDDEENPDDD